MALRMARPWKDPKTGVHHLRQRVPSDLAARLRGTLVTLPVGDTSTTVKIGSVVQASLKTKDTAKAKELHAAADAALRRFWEGHRKRPVRLTHKQTVALAGKLYHAIVDEWQEDPSEPRYWARAFDDVRAASTLPAGTDAEAAERLRQLEEVHGDDVNDLLDREGLIIDADSRSRLLNAFAPAVEDAIVRLKRNAEGDYRADPQATRFPEWQRPSEVPAAAPQPSSGKLTADALFDAWAAFQEGKRAVNTIKRYRASFKFLEAFLKGRDVNSLSADDIHAWAEHRRDHDKIEPSAINRNDLVAVSSVFKWATSREGSRRMVANPAALMERLTENRAAPIRERSFREAEVKAILQAALAVPSDLKNPTAAAAKRWCPWLAAYSGARISELTGLTGEDIRVEAGVPVMDFRKTKTGNSRTVPIHEHLVEQGFLEFARQHGAKPLFYDPSRRRKGTEADPAELRGRTVGKWVRDTVKLDKALQPDHGWRHTWKTIALEIGVQERLSDAITGHSVKKVGRNSGRGYEHVTVKMMAEVMRRFPKFSV